MGDFQDDASSLQLQRNLFVFPFYSHVLIPVSLDKNIPNLQDETTIKRILLVVVNHATVRMTSGKENDN